MLCYLCILFKFDIMTCLGHALKETIEKKLIRLIENEKLNIVLQ